MSQDTTISDHDLLVRLTVKVEDMAKDLKEIRDGTRLTLNEHEKNLIAHTRRLDELSLTAITKDSPLAEKWDTAVDRLNRLEQYFKVAIGAMTLIVPVLSQLIGLYVRSKWGL